MAKFSVLLPVFHKAHPIFLEEALDSILVKQSCKPTELIIMVDGIPIYPLKKVLKKYQDSYPDQVITHILPEHQGTGHALKVGVELCSYELIFRMDADDIAVPDRFEKQLNFIEKHPDIDVLGGVIEEFRKTPGDLNRYRAVPQTHRKIYNMAKFRSPINHPTVLFKKSKVLAAGNYSNDFHLLEDYALWILMLKNNAKFYNMQEVLLYFRLGEEKKIEVKRRGNKISKSFLKFNEFAYQLGFYNKVEYHLLSFLRILFFSITPSGLFGYIHKKITRRHKG